MKLKQFLFLGLGFVLFFSCGDQPVQNNTTMSPKPLPEFDWQGHRGARGLIPENTVPSFLKALELNMRTLEMDAAIAKDGKVIISHEPWFSHEISTTPDGEAIVDEAEKNHLIAQMTTEELQQYDVGLRGNQRFPEQKKMAIHKPTLEEVVDAVNKYCAENNQTLPFYNIEIKSRPEWDGKLAPKPEQFASILLKEIKRLGIYDKACIQSFDTRSLLAVNKLDKKITTAYLIENINPFSENMEKLDFVPSIYSPYFQLVTDTLVQQVHAKGMDLIPWTINEVGDMKRLKALGIDGIITDYPNLVEGL